MTELGRFQRGDRVTVDVATPTLPDALPTLAVMGPGNVTLGQVLMARCPDANGFRSVLRLGPEYGLGTYALSVVYAVAGAPQQAVSAFEVVAGGDPGGPIISLYSHNRPEGRYLLAQTGGGRLTQGRNPRL